MNNEPDPLADWTLERDYNHSLGSERPHRLTLSPGWHVWLTDADADDVERALDALNDIEPPRRFTAEQCGSGGAKVAGRWVRFLEDGSAVGSTSLDTVTVLALAAEIRRVDGNHDLGAAALAEALLPWITARAAGAVR